ncbi:NUDIX domain-containing protein [Isobaculum melis]|uniref:8-oxo-dGTP diphosphatase n=1 Tax=Isobaculum melis TaxID=142588 RepID=A0A1H9T090_9LACT|nr:NUDIX domain-containing protein [Isobaculum melis]SER90434.1 8-oxo-dGTP diphosphatase [Isobaculum melis]
MKSFGQRDDTLIYAPRKGAYAIIQNTENQFLVVESPDKELFLVGGGIEGEETPIEALHRETLEETGYTIQIEQNLGEAEKHFVSWRYPTLSQHNIGYFYVCSLEEKIAEPIETEPMKWVTLDKLESHLFHEHHLYMVKKALQNI